jgi:hypothetical protein
MMKIMWIKTQPDTQTHRHTDTQTHRHTDTQTHRHTDTQTHRHPYHSYTAKQSFNALFDTSHFTMFTSLTLFMKVISLFLFSQNWPYCFFKLETKTIQEMCKFHQACKSFGVLKCWRGKLPHIPLK